MGCVIGLIIGCACLMLLMEHPRRLSTDIDIIAEPGTDLDKYLDRASEIFPFKDVEEQKRIGKNNIEKSILSSPMIHRSITGHSTFFWMFCLNTIIIRSWFKKKFRMIFSWQNRNTLLFPYRQQTVWSCKDSAWILHSGTSRDNVERHADGSVTRKPKRYTGKKD